MKFIKLFEPISIKGCEIRNRMVLPAMHMSYSDDGMVNDLETNFYIERAKGGAGLIILGGCSVEVRGGGPNMLRIDDDKYIPGYTQFAKEMHKHGAKVAAQLYHSGRYAMSFVSKQQPVSASAVYSRFSRETPKALSIDEIKEVQEHIADGAERAKKANFDAVELLSSAGYLMNQFLSPITNIREDKYGGSFENRLRFPLELIQTVRERVGDDFIVGIRISGDDFMPGSNTYVENAKIAKKYAEAGIDFINVTGGWHETRIPQILMEVPQGAYVYLAENIKSKVNVPVFSGNRINDPIIAEQILRDEKADCVSMGRAFISDPYFPQKVKNNQLWDIIKCVGCNQGCFDHVFKIKPVECMRNYIVSREGKIDLAKKTENPKKVLIIGAGPAGLEAARVATILGHDVTIVDKSNSIGGQVKVGFVPHGRHQIRDILDYYEGQIQHRNINLKLGVEATPEFINNFNADAVLFATGVKFAIPPIPGIDGSTGSNICFADDALAGDYPIGKNVVIVGGAATGVETAIWAARLGAMSPEIAHFLHFHKCLPDEEILSRWQKGTRKVTMIEMLPKIGTSIGKSSRGFLLGEMTKLGVDVITSAKITKFDGDKVEFTHNDDEKILSNIDTFILATGVKRNRDLYNKINEMKPSYKTYVIGDSKKPRTIMDSIHDGFKIAYNLDKK